MIPEFYDQFDSIQPYHKAGQKPNFPAMFESNYQGQIRSYIMTMFICGVLLMLFIIIK